MGEFQTPLCSGWRTFNSACVPRDRVLLHTRSDLDKKMPSGSVPIKLACFRWALHFSINKKKQPEIEIVIILIRSLLFSEHLKDKQQTIQWMISNKHSG